MVVLTAITKDILPHGTISITSNVPNSNKRNQDRFLDPELYAVNLENALVSHFMFSESEYNGKCVSSRKQAYGMGEAISEKLSFNEAAFLGGGFTGQDVLESKSNYNKKFHGYVVYVAYRLERYYPISHNAKLSTLQGRSNQLSKLSTNGPGQATLTNFEQITEENDIDNDEDGNGAKSKSRSTSATKAANAGLAALGKGTYDIDELDEDDDIADPRDDNAMESGEEGDEEEGDEADDEKMLEELEDKQLMSRIGSLEGEHRELLEQVKKLEHGRTWVENRLTSLESDIGQIKGEEPKIKSDK